MSTIFDEIKTIQGKGSLQSAAPTASPVQGTTPTGEKKPSTIFDELKDGGIPAKAEPKVEAPSRSVADALSDVVVSGSMGGLDLIKGGIGLADLVTGSIGDEYMGKAGKAVSGLQDTVEDWYSPAQKAANESVENAEGFVGKAKAMIQSPSTIVQGLARTLPMMAGGGTIARGLGAVAPRIMGTTTGRIIGSGVGEGSLQAGSATTDIRQQTGDVTGEQAGMALASGLTTGAITAASGGLARRLGFADADSLMAGVNKKTGKKMTPVDVAKSIIGGGVSEGAFEEMPQSGQETVWMNAALGKPLMEGVPEAMAEGGVLGAVMGSGLNAAQISKDAVLQDRFGASSGEWDALDENLSGDPLADSITSAVNQSVDDLANTDFQKPPEVLAAQQFAQDIIEGGVDSDTDKRIKVDGLNQFYNDPEVSKEAKDELVNSGVFEFLNIKRPGAVDPMDAEGPMQAEWEQQKQAAARTNQERNEEPLGYEPELPPAIQEKIDAEKKSAAGVKEPSTEPGTVSEKVVEKTEEEIAWDKQAKESDLYKKKSNVKPDEDLGYDPDLPGTKQARLTELTNKAKTQELSKAENAEVRTLSAPDVKFSREDAGPTTSSQTPIEPGVKSGGSNVDAKQTSLSTEQNEQQKEDGSAATTPVGSDSIRYGKKLPNGNHKITDKTSDLHGEEFNATPTEQQKEAENYKTIKKSYDGIKLSIENPAGSTRSGTDESGKQWSQKMNNHYARILGSVGFDKDHVDAFVANGYEGGASHAYVVNQVNEKGAFDEHKTVIGATSEADALAIYNSNYEQGWTGGKSVTKLAMPAFKKWVAGPGPAKGELVRQRTVPAKQLQGKSSISETKVPEGEKKYSISKEPATSLASVRNSWKKQGIDNFVSEKNGVISVSSIVVPKSERGSGKGTTAMKELTAYADKTGQKIVLSPSKDFGASSVARLKKFYKKAGFVENKGRNKDYQISESMYRAPNVKYAIGETKQQTVTRNLLEEVFPGQQVNSGMDGGTTITTKGGVAITITPNADIKIDLDTASRAYKRAIGKKDVAQGSFQVVDGRAIIQLAKTAGKGTVKHEAYHAAEELVLTKDEVSVLRKRYGSAEQRADAYSKWDGETENTVFQRIKDFFHQLANQIGLTNRDMTDVKARKIFADLYQGKTWDRKGVNERNQIKIGDIIIGMVDEDAQYQLDAQKWLEAPQHLDIFGTVNNRLGKELEVLEYLLGPVESAQMFPGKQDLKGNRPLTRTIKARDLGEELFKARDDGRLAKLVDRKIAPKDLADELGFKGKKRSKFITEVKELRSGPLMTEIDDSGNPVLSQNGKAGMSVDLILGTCQPTGPCQECYAAASMIRMSAVRKAFRNTVHMLVDPKDFGKRIAAEATKVHRSKLPFIRLLGSGDLTTDEAVEAFNELAKNADRPIHIFSRHHDNLAKLEGTQVAPFIKMGSLDSDLVEHYGLEFLKLNMADRGINNAFLNRAPEEKAIVDELVEADSLGLILSVSEELHEGLGPKAQKRSCPCDAEERSYMGSCRQCALNNAGCYTAFLNTAVDTNGKIWNLDNNNLPKDTQPTLSFLQGATPMASATTAEAFSEVANDIVKKSIELINLYRGKFLTHKEKIAEHKKQFKAREKKFKQEEKVRERKFDTREATRKVNVLKKKKEYIEKKFKPSTKGPKLGALPAVPTEKRGVAITIKDLRWPDDTVTLVDKDLYVKRTNEKNAERAKKSGKDPVVITEADLVSTDERIYTDRKTVIKTVDLEINRLRAIMEVALVDQTFYLPGGEIQKPTAYREGEKLAAPELISKEDAKADTYGFKEDIQFSRVEAQEGSITTQVENGKAYVNNLKKYIAGTGTTPKTILDYGAGLGTGTDGMQAYLPEATVHSLEPNPGRWKGKVPPTYTSNTQIKKKYDLVMLPNVLNVVSKDIRDAIVKDAVSHLSKNGQLIIGVRGAKGDVLNAKNSRPGEEAGSIWITKNSKGEKIDVYQKGFDGTELVDYLQDAVPDGYTVGKYAMGNNGAIISAPGVKYSQGAKTGTGTNVREELSKDLTPAGLQALEDSGVINIVTPGQLPSLLGKNYDPAYTDKGFIIGDKIYLVEGNIGTGEALDILVHELGSHDYLDTLLKDNMGDVVSMLEEGAKKNTQQGKAIRAAKARIPKSTKPEHYNSEWLAYYIQNGKRADSLYRKIIAYVKDALIRMGINPKTVGLKPEDLRAIAMVGIRKKAKASAKKMDAAAQVLQQPVKQRSSKLAPTFYSRLSETIASKMGKTTTPAALLKSIEQWKKKGTLSAPLQEELEWSGLEEWLSVSDGKVSKQEVLDFLKENGVKIEEVVKSGTNTDDPDGTQDVEGDYYDLNPNGWEVESIDDNGLDIFYIIDGDGEAYMDEETGDAIEFQVERSADNKVQEILEDEYSSMSQADVLEALGRDPNPPVGGGTVHEKYTIPGGKNYRELLLTLPNKKSPERLEFEEISKKRMKIAAIDGKLTEEQRTELREINELFDEKYPDGEFPDKKDDYKTTHYMDDKNILAHVRFNERKDADGNRILFLEEVQSDWHQEGRTEGYDKPITKLPDDHYIEKTEKGYVVRDSIGEAQSMPQKTPEMATRELLDWLNDRSNPNAVPDAPFKTSWPMLAMKRVIRYAAENGFDKVAWTSGAQQADRYDLSKQVDEVIVAKRTDGKYLIQAVKDGNALLTETVDDKGLEANLGKEFAKKVKDDNLPAGDTRTYKDDNLKVGGAGMKSFYDKMLPSQVGKFIKKFKAKVSPQQVQFEQDDNWVSGDMVMDDLGIPKKDRTKFWLDAYNDGKHEELIKAYRDKHSSMSQAGFDLTPELIGSALGTGMPLFSKKEVRTVTKKDVLSSAFKKWFGKSKVQKNGNPIIVYHGSASFGTSNDKWTFESTAGEAQTGSPLSGMGNFFALDKIEALGYTRGTGNVHRFALQVENPLVMNSWDMPTFNDTDEARAFGKRKQLQGYDAVYIKDQGHIVTFEPEQAKSLDQNTGEFSSTDPDVRYSRNENLNDIKVMSSTENLNAEMDGETSASSVSHGEKIINEIYRKLAAVSSPAVAKGRFGADQFLATMEKYQIARKVIYEPLKSAAEKQKFAAQFVQKLPPVPKAKLLQALSTISRVKNPEAQQRKLEAFLVQADKVLTTHLRTEIIDKIETNTDKTKTQKKSGGKVQQGRGADFERDLKYLRETALNADENRGVDKEFADLVEEVEKLEVEIEETSSPAEHKRIWKEIDELDSQKNLLQVFGGIGSQNFDELVRSWKALSVFLSDGRLPWRDQLEATRERNIANRKKLIENVTGQEDPEVENVAQETQRLKREDSVSGKFKEAMSAASNMIQSWELMLDKISRPSGGKTLSSWAVKHYGSVAHKATRDNEQMMLDTNDQVLDAAVKIFNVKDNSALAAKLAKLDKIDTENIKTYVTKEGEALAISPLQAAYWYQINKDHTNPVVQQTFEKMGVTDKTFQQIEKAMGPELKAWADYLVDTFYQDFHTDTNAIHQQMYGIDLEKTANYVPWHRKVFGKAADKEKEGFLANISPASVKKGGLRSRVVNTKPFKVKNINDVLISHIADMSHFKAWALPTREINGTFNSPEVQSFIRSRHGASTAKTIRRFQDRFVRSDGEIIEDMKFLDQVRGNVTKAMIGMNPVVFFKQLSSIPAYMSDIPAADWFKYTGQFFTNPAKHARILGRSTMMKSRYKRGFERDVATAMKKGGSDVVAQKKRFGDSTMMLTQLGDKMAITVGGWAVYKHHLEKLKKGGMSHKKAHDQAITQFEMATERAQQSGHDKDMGWFQGGTPVMRLFTMFMTSPASYSRQIFTAFRNMKDDPANSAKRLFVYAVVMPVMFQAIADALLAFDGDDDDKERLLTNQFKALAMGPLNGLPVIRTMAQGYLQAISGAGFYRGQFTPAMEGFETSRRAIADFAKFLDDGTEQIGPDEYLERSLIGLIHTLGYATGVPTKPVQRITTGWYDAATGETEHPIRRSIGFSKYAVGE